MNVDALERQLAKLEKEAAELEDAIARAERRADLPPGECACGCGERTSLAPGTDRSKGWVKGEPVKYVKGHEIRMRL